MDSIAVYALGILTGLGFGGWINELLRKRGMIKAKEHRIVIDAPFSPEQSETIMKCLQELNEAVRKSV